MREDIPLRGAPPQRTPCHAVRAPAAVAAALVLSVAAWAQLPSLVIQDATILVGDGTTLEPGSILISGETISGVGRRFSGVPAQSVAAEGKFVTPGLIDAWSTLGLRDSRAEGRPAALGLENFNRYDRDAIQAALRQGVTMVFVPARGREGVSGQGAVVRLAPVGSDVEDKYVVLKEAGLCAAVGVDGQGVLARVRGAAELDKQLREAKEYRESLDAYEEELKEYEEKIKKRAEEAGKGDKTDNNDAKGERTKATAGVADMNGTEDIEGAAEPQESGDAPPPPRRRRGDRPGPPTGAASAGATKSEGDQKKEEIKKPKKPDRDVNKETLLRLIDGELRLYVEVERPEDILNVLDIGAKHNVALVLNGASGAAWVADALAKAEVPVVLGLASQTMLFDPGPRRFALDDAAQRLHAAGVPVVFGTGPSGATANLGMIAAQAVGRGMPEDKALAAITSQAARLLGVDKDYGRIARGQAADLVVWSHHPFDPRAKVEAVYIAGQEVYRATEGPED